MMMRQPDAHFSKPSGLLAKVQPTAQQQLEPLAVTHVSAGSGVRPVGCEEPFPGGR